MLIELISEYGLFLIKSNYNRSELNYFNRCNPKPSKTTVEGNLIVKKS